MGGVSAGEEGTPLPFSVPSMPSASRSQSPASRPIHGNVPIVPILRNGR